MGAIYGSARRAPVPYTGEDRSIVWPYPMINSNYATVDASGEGALQSIAVRSSIDLIASLVSELPVHCFRGDGASRKQLKTPGNIQDPGDDGLGLEDWTYQVVESWLYRGNAYGDPVKYDPAGRLRAIQWFHPDDVAASLDPNTGQLTWLVKGKSASIEHRRVNPVPGRVLGLSPIQQHALQIGGSISAAQFGAQWFKDGAHPSALLVNTLATIDEPGADKVKKRWMNLFQGSREPAVFGKGWEYKPIQVTPEESQFLQTQGFSEAQCARIFGPAVAEILGYETGGSMTYANVVDRRTDLLVFTLNRWIRRVERILTDLLPAPQYARFDRDALLESNTLVRYQAHESALRNSWKTVNEVRSDEDMTPVEWGDEPVKAAAPAPAPAEKPDEPDDEEQQKPGGENGNPVGV